MSQTLSTARTTVAVGKWLADGIFQTPDRKLWFTIAYLKLRYKSIYWSMWYDWMERACPDLDPAINDGRINTLPAECDSGGTGTVWSQEDADSILARREQGESGLRARRTPPGADGQWLSDDLFQHREIGIMARDKKLAELCNTAASGPGRWRRKRHPALDPNVNDGKLRSIEVAPLAPRSGGWGRRRVPVSSLDDYQAITKWKNEQDQIPGQAPAGWKTAKELWTSLNIRSQDERMALSFALRSFRSEHPESAERDRKPDTARNRVHRPWRYDDRAFVRWLAGRTLEEVAASERRKSTKTKEERLRKTGLFIFFILTHGRYSAKLWQKFLANPPYGKELPSAGLVLANDGKAWAKEAGLPNTKLLKKAKKAVGVQYTVKGFGPGHKTYWSLPAPVVIPRPEGHQARDARRDQASPSTDGNGHETPPAGQTPDMADGAAPAQVKAPPPPNPSENGGKRSRGRRPGFTPPGAAERRQRIIEACRSGEHESISEIARVLGLDRSTVSKVLSNAGLTP
jgi:hypothetical protein